MRYRTIIVCDLDNGWTSMKTNVEIIVTDRKRIMATVYWAVKRIIRYSFQRLPRSTKINRYFIAPFAIYNCFFKNKIFEKL